MGIFEKISFVFKVGYILIINMRYIRTSNYDQFAIYAFDSLAKINILYIKFIQILAIQNIFSEYVNEILLSYTDQVSYNDSEIDLSFLDLFPKQEKSEFHLINSGTMSLIYKHRLELEDNKYKEVVVKVLRKNIKEKLDISISNFEFLLSIIQWIPYIRKTSLNVIFNENKDKLYDHIDFHKELAYLKEMGKNYKNIDYIYVPKCYDEYCDSKCITMDYLYGDTITEIDSNEDKEQFSNLLVKFAIKGFLFDRVFHGDIHSGNILFIKGSNENTQDIPEYSLGVIDFGIMGKFTRKEQNYFYHLFKAISENNVSNISKNFLPFLTPFEKIEFMDNTNKSELLKCMDEINNDIFNNKLDFGFNEICRHNSMLKKYELSLSSTICRPLISMFGLKNMCEYLSEESFINKVKTYSNDMMDTMM